MLSRGSLAAAPAQQPVARPPERSFARRWLVRALAVIYGLAMFEVVIMVSPFAFYFYAAYGPMLKWLNHSTATAWLTGFVLPHSVFTTSRFLEFLRWDFGRYAFAFGLFGFAFFAVQIYGSRLFHRTMVSSGVYRYIRHPQYLCLEVSAFALFTMWPRMIIFLLFAGMLFAYYFLARFEERRMLAVHPQYAEYMRRTGMFFPGNPGGRLYRFLFAGMRDQRFAYGLAIAGSALLVFLSALGMRAYTLRHISRSTDASAIQAELVSVYPMEAAEMRQLVGLALSDSRVANAVHQEKDATFVIHILPRDYGMVNMFADVGPRHLTAGNIHLSRLGHLGEYLVPFLNTHERAHLMGSKEPSYWLVFSRVDGPDGKPVALNRIFELSATMTPVYMADVNSISGHVSKTIDPPSRGYWGDVKMPIF